ncbi:MAG: hypothetical protein JWQ30_965 [Sediminibacterium sp.]|nr:hypothetical protein [Sediminibacterium sp.]
MKIIHWFRNHFELLCWITALVALFFLPENKPETSLCFFSLLCFGHCPGCGVGHAIHYALHLQFAASFQHHPLGIFGVIVIFIRVKQLLYPVKSIYETKPDQHDPRH